MIWLPFKTLINKLNYFKTFDLVNSFAFYTLARRSTLFLKQLLARPTWAGFKAAEEGRAKIM